MKVTSANFAELANRTKSPTCFLDDILNNIEHIGYLLIGIEGRCKQLDKIKKAVFYSKSGNLTVSQRETDLMHSVIGIVTEVGELSEGWRERKGDENILEEFSDILWYLAIGIESLPNDVVRPQDGETKLEAVMRRNIQKLQARYPEKFSSENAENRNIAAEMKAMGEN